jgi:squalene synthase HpnC
VRDELSPARILARAGGENFPVATRLLPPRTRRDLLALYGFARLVDQAGDDATGDRLALLDALEADLERVWTGDPHHPLIARLVPAVFEHHLGIEPFRRLIEANRRDQVQRRYATFDELLAYCALSANPVGELVLGVFGAATADRVARSDDVCTALQLAEHWQDVSEDYARGRVYLPAEDLGRFGVDEAELGTRSATGAFRRLMAFEVSRARALIDRGAPLIRTLHGRSALAVALFVSGGRAALAAIERADYDVLGRRPRPGRAARAIMLLRTLTAREVT